MSLRIYNPPNEDRDDEGPDDSPRRDLKLYDESYDYDQLEDDNTTENGCLGIAISILLFVVAVSVAAVIF